MKKKHRKIQMIFESPILALRDEAAKLGKASRDAYNQG